MLRQVALLPSGPTTSPLPVLRASSKGRFAVCATLAVYVYNQEHFTHESVITFDDKKLMSISWSADGQKIAGVSQESSIFYADVQTGVSKLVFASKFRVVDITCCPLKPDVIYVLTTAHIMRLDLQRDKKATEGGEDAADDFAYTVEKTQIAAFSNIPTSVAYKVVTGGGLRATVALDDGMIVHVDVGSKKVTGRFRCNGIASLKDHSHVIHVSWDPLSAQYFAAAHKDGNLTLWDAESTSAPIFSFAKQPSGSVSSIVWMPSVPGGFVTFSSRGGVLRIWNVSNPTPLSSIKVDCAGIKDVCIPSEGRGTRAYCAFSDRVAVVDLDTKNVLWETAAGHVDTIFTCTFYADPDVLLTGGYDQRVKEWNTLTGECTRTFCDAGGLIYDLSVSDDGKELAVATEAGDVKVFDYTSGIVTHSIRQAKDAGCCYFVSWYRKSAEPDAERSNLLVGYGNGSVCIVSKFGDVRTSLKVGGSRDRISGAIDPFDDTRVALTCGHTIHLVSIAMGTAGGADPQISKLTSTVSADKKCNFFTAAFSPHTRDALAATCDDSTVYIFGLDAQGKLERRHRLRGHAKKSRAIVWHTEFPWLVLSSSWDGSVVAWDVRSGSPVCRALGHNADVYGLALHPQRPFVIATTSRDSTVRLWEMAGSFRVPALEAITGGDFVHAPAKEESKSERPIQLSGGHVDATGMKLWGKASRALDERLRQLRTGPEAKSGGEGTATAPATYEDHSSDSQGGDALIARAKAISNFFYLPVRHHDIWLLVGAMKRALRGGINGAGDQNDNTTKEASITPAKNGKASTGQGNESCVPHVSIIDPSMRIRAVERHSAGTSRSFGVGAAGRAQALREAATTYMKVGDTQKYCEIMIQMGNWHEALVVAPSVSISYWRELMQRHTRLRYEECAGDMSLQKLEELVPHMVITEQHEKLVNLMVMCEQYDDACALSRKPRRRRNENVHDEHEGDMAPTSTVTIVPAASDLGGGYATAQDVSGPAANGKDLGRGTALEVNDTPSAPGTARDLDQVERIRYLQADQFMSRGQAIEAACCHLSIDDVDGCLAKLIRGNEIELAFLLMQAIGSGIRQPTEGLLFMFGMLASDVDVPSVAYKVVDGIEERLLERTVITVRHCIRLDDASADAFHAEYGMRTAKAYADDAAALKDDMKNHEKVMEKVRLLLLGRQYEEAVRFGLRYLRTTVSCSSWCKDHVAAIVRLLSLVDIELLTKQHEAKTQQCEKPKDGDALATVKEIPTDDSQQLITQVMFYAAYVAALLAMEAGYRSIVRPLIDMAIECSSRVQQDSLANFASDVMILERERYAAQYEPSIAVAALDSATKNVIVIDLVETAVEKVPSSKAVGMGLASLKSALEGQLHAHASSLARSSTGGCDIITRHGSIPSFAECKTTRSVLGNMVTGTPCVLEDGKSFMSIDDAIAWRRVCAYSPLLTGMHMPAAK